MFSPFYPIYLLNRHVQARRGLETLPAHTGQGEGYTVDPVYHRDDTPRETTIHLQPI